MLSDRSKVSCMASQENNKKIKVKLFFFFVMSVEDSCELHIFPPVSRNKGE